MPLARILTLRPEEATGLFEQLQQLGFEVEVTSPHQRNLAPADLEIEFAICEQQQILGRAAAIAAQLQADVVVFPGALPPLPRSAAIAEVPVSFPDPVEMQPAPEPVETPLEPEPVLTPMVRVLEEEAARPAWSAKFAEGLQKSGRQIASGVGLLAGKLRSGMVWLGSLAASAALKFKSTTSSAGSRVAGRTREYQERVRLRATQMQAARAQRLAQMERRRAEAREQVEALERARMAAEAQHQQLQRLDAAAEQPARQREVKAGRPRMLQLRGVFAGAAAAVALFLVGWLLANFQAAAPLPATLSDGKIEQQVPFGAATVHGPPGVTVGGVGAAKAVRAPRPNIAPLQQSKPRPATHTTEATRQKSERHRFRNKSNRDEDDVVVRHFGPPKKPVTQTAQQQAGIKRYSDQ